MLVRDQEVGGSNPLAPTKFLKDLQTPNRDKKGPFLDPTPTRTLHAVGRCRCVLTTLPSDGFEDLLGPDQEV